MGLPARFVARPSRPKIFLLLVGLLVFVACGLWMLQDPSASRITAWSCITFFGLGAVICIARLLDRDDQITVDAQGILYKQWSRDVIPWNEITDLTEAQVKRSQFLCLHLAHPERYPPRTVFGRLAWLNKKMGYGDVSITPGGTDKTFEELKAAVLGYREGRHIN